MLLIFPGDTHITARAQIIENSHENNFPLKHPGVLATKVGYFGVKSTKVPPGADGHLIC